MLLFFFLLKYQGYDAECPSGQSCFANTPCDAQVANFALPRSAMNLAIQFNAERGIPTNGVLPSAAFDNARLSLASFFFGYLFLLLQAH